MVLQLVNWLALQGFVNDYVSGATPVPVRFSCMDFLSDLFELPYYAVIFSSVRSQADAADYAGTAARMLDLAREADGYLGVETLGNGSNGITVSYWRDEAAIAAWRNEAEHAEAQAKGRQTWYQDFRLRIARVERAYGMNGGK